MQPIIIGAGRGRRLNALTDSQPKCYSPIGGRPILDWTLQAFEGPGLKTPVFIGGYRIEQIRADYPQLCYCHNADWQNNNILLSLLYARDHMADGFVCAYSDILFRDTVVRRALEHPADIVLCVDTRWRQRYGSRTQHPEGDAEKVMAEGDRVMQVSRHIIPDDADGEYIGVARLTPRGAARFCRQFDRAQQAHRGKPWGGAPVFEKAYLIALFQEMIQEGTAIHMVTTDGEYMEVDTEEDYDLANRRWPQIATDGPA